MKKILLNSAVLRQTQAKVIETVYEEFILLSAALNQNPYNVDIVQIAQKVALINTIYSTGLHRYKSKLQVHSIAKIIASITNFDWRVAHGCPYLVNEIAKKSKSAYGVNLFSFATKYCFAHNFFIYQRDDYSMYDQNVHDALVMFFDYNKKDIEEWKNNVDYPSFNKSMKLLLDRHNIEISSQRRLLDCYLWNLAKTEKRILNLGKNGVSRNAKSE